jgi:hypothetical protein
MTDQTGVDPEYRRYLAEIELYEKEFKPWETRGKKILKLYKDADNVQGKRKRFNVLWSNVQTLLPACYARDPQPVAERRFKDADPVGRTASEVLERCLSYTIDCNGFGHTMRQVVSDRFLPGRGQAWVRYEPTFETVEPEIDENDDDEDLDAIEEPEETLSYEKALLDYVYWEDFGHNVARTWDEVWIVWRRVYMTRAKLVKRFGTVGKNIPLDYTPRGLKDEKSSEDIKKACIYEGWDKEKGQVVFLSKGHPKLIEVTPDPLELTGMFPCPRPLYATVTTDSLMPVADYALYQTQAQEIEELTVRIDGLQEALKLRGAYDASAPELGLILTGAGNKLIPVKNWASFSEKGGIEGAIQFVPIKEVAETLIALYEAREKSKADLYELTGIADIIRGNSEPEETATAQQIKGRFAVLRISDTQADVQRFARDSIRQLGEVIAEHFDLETIKAISGIKLLMAAEKEMLQKMQQQEQMAAQQAQQGQQQPSQIPEEQLELLSQPTWEEVHALLSDQVLREFRIDIETDSTIRTDEDADRIARTEFLTAAGAYMDKAAIVYQTMPEMGPLLGEMLMFGVRSFRSARSLEPVFEDAMKKLAEPKPPQPDPELQKEQLKAQSAKELEQLKAQTTMQVEQSKQQMQAQENAATAQIEDQRAERDGQRELVIEREKMQMTMELEKFKAQLQAQVDLQTAQIQGQQAEADRQFQASQQGADRESNERTKAAELSVAERTKQAELQHQSQEGEKQRQHEAKTAEDTEKKSGEKSKQREGSVAALQKIADTLAKLKGID